MKRAVRYSCCECGRPVPIRLVRDGETFVPSVGRCPLHPEAKRYGAAFARKWFEAMRAAVGMPSLGEVIGAMREARSPYRWPNAADILLALKGGAS